MLGVNKYPQAFIDASRARVKAQVASYRKMQKAAKSDSATAAFEPEFFNNMVIVLDSYFVHRLRGIEGKDGNPLNEVRMLCNSLVQNGGVMTADKTIRMKPADTVLQYDFGDTIAVTAADFTRLADAYFAEIESKFAG
ncbi:MAG TPA: hypothetical protein VGP92_09755 [Acidimicrobiia bacterium]|jgi:hypothetical protein|nr:hypothetical protein [Acidimicrobiia bacterium]